MVTWRRAIVLSPGPDYTREYFRVLPADAPLGSVAFCGSRFSK